MRDARALTLELLKEPTERDKQRLVGASNFSQGCARCLADALLQNDSATEPEDRPYWAGAVIGTAIHDLLDARAQRLHPEWEPERRVVLGELPGYGVIKSTTDLYVPEDRLCIDYKTTTKAKLPHIKEALTTEPTEYDLSKVAEARYKVSGYLNQVMSYGRGLVLAGKPVEYVSLVFICRDAVGDQDIWAFTTNYDAEQADAVWNRLERLWTALQNGLDPATLKSHPNCYHCNHYRD